MKKVIAFCIILSAVSCVDSDPFLFTNAIVESKDVSFEGGNMYRSKVYKRITADDKEYVADMFIMEMNSTKKYTGERPYSFSLSATDTTKRNRWSFTEEDMTVNMKLTRAPTVNNPSLVREYDRLIKGSFVVDGIKKKVREDVITGKFSFVLVSDAKYGFSEPDTVVFDNGTFKGKLDYYDSYTQ